MVKSLMKLTVFCGAVALLLPSAAKAQDDACKSLHYRSNFRLNGAQMHLSLADGSSYADTKRNNARDAIQTAAEALQSGTATGPGETLTAWFFMGRGYLLLGDLAGADSAFTHASAAATAGDGCEAEIQRLRHNAWVPLQQSAAAMIQQQNYDSGLVLLRQSNLIFQDPGSYYNMAVAYMQKQKDDSAAAMFRQAMHTGTNPAGADMRAQAGLNAARLLTRGNNLPAAESTYRDYIALKPGDMSARGALATILNQEHRSADAAAVYDSILARADSLDSFQLFDAGVSLFNLAVTDTVRADSAQKMSYFQRAARAFDGAAGKSPNYRDALFNLSNTYLALGDHEKFLASAKRLVAVDSLNQQSWQLLAGAFQNVGRDIARHDSILRARRDSLPLVAQLNAAAHAYRDSTLRALARRDSLPLQVTIGRFEPRDSTASIRGAVQNLTRAEHAPFTLTIEFLGTRGEVVTTERVDIPALNAAGSPGQAYDFNLQASGRGIIAYRYKVS